MARRARVYGAAVIRTIARAALSLLANAVALVVAAVLLDKVSLTLGGFVLAVAVFTGVAIVVEPLIRQTAVRNAPAILGSTALVATLVSLIVTVILTDGLQISGSLTWIMATVVVWGILGGDGTPTARA